MTKRDRKERMETGADSAGQGGATQQISDTALADSESVEELAEEGKLIKEGKQLRVLVALPDGGHTRQDVGATPPIFSRNPNQRVYGAGEFQDEEALLRRGIEPTGN